MRPGRIWCITIGSERIKDSITGSWRPGPKLVEGKERWSAESVWADYKFVIFGTDMIGNALCIFELAEILFFESDGKRFDRPLAFLRHQGDHGR